MKIARPAATLLVLVPCAVVAQDLRPGLWEVTQRTRSSSGQVEQGMAQLQQQMDSMSPEQRAMVEEMMARQGMRMGPPGAGGMTVKMCLTPEMVGRHQLPSRRGDCQTTQRSRSGNTMQIAFTCESPPSSGEGQVVFLSPEAYTMTLVVNSQQEGRPEQANMEASGKWVAEDCGDVKPVTPAK